ncbi:MAG: saccharopine dehydrogenase [Acidobacteria bacterium]|nr:saccharopine dehydrogenase [Acidobacteriota bacterium]
MAERDTKAARDFDIVLYGASGFTGRQTVDWFVRNTAPGEVRLAIAGRNRAKLEAVRDRHGERLRDTAVIVADAKDQRALEMLAARTRVMLTTAGPYSIYGSGLVAACVNHCTHYVDITGETAWVHELIKFHHQRALLDGTRVIPFCGFDSVPSDLGTMLMVRRIQREFGIDCGRVEGFHQMQGGLNGGTMATVFFLYESEKSKVAARPYVLSPELDAKWWDPKFNGDPRSPHYDSFLKAWCAPFVMGPINTRVVRRSATLFNDFGEGYGSAFSYQEYTKFPGYTGIIGAGALSLGSALFEKLMKSEHRRLLKRVVPRPGEGPSEKTMNEGWFRCELVATAADGRKIRGLIADRGDPGNRATVNFLCESALTLAVETDQLPGGPSRGGVLTPATGLGEILATRLRRRGMTIDTNL